MEDIFVHIMWLALIYMAFLKRSKLWRQPKAHNSSNNLSSNMIQASVAIMTEKRRRDSYGSSRNWLARNNAMVTTLLMMRLVYSKKLMLIRFVEPHMSCLKLQRNKYLPATGGGTKSWDPVRSFLQHEGNNRRQPCSRIHYWRSQNRCCQP